MTAQVTYDGALRTAATHLKSGNQIITDAPTDNYGKGEAFSPTDLVATALASCLLTVMGIRAEKMGLNMDGARANVNKIMASNPRRIQRVEITVQMPTDQHFSDDHRKLLERIARTCPVANSLHTDLEQVLDFKWD